MRSECFRSLKVCSQIALNKTVAIWPNLIWPSLFGRIWPNRIWPKLSGRIWPTLFGRIWSILFDRIWPDRIWPIFFFWWGPGGVGGGGWGPEGVGCPKGLGARTQKRLGARRGWRARRGWGHEGVGARKGGGPKGSRIFFLSEGWPEIWGLSSNSLKRWSSRRNFGGV